MQYSFFTPEIVSQAHEDPHTWKMVKKIQKNKHSKFYPKITKTGVIKNVDHHIVTSRNYATA